MCIKKRSKISLQFEQLKYKEIEYNNNITEEKEECNSKNDFSDDFPENIHLSKYNENNLNDYKQFEIYFYCVINGNEYIFPIKTDFLNVKKEFGYDLIKNIVKKINNNNLIVISNSIKNIISLKDIEDDDNKDFYINNYELRHCKKKSMMPKHDLPAFSSYYLLEKLSNERISFISKNSLNIMLTEKFEDYNEQCPIKEKINELTNKNINNKQNIKNIFVNPNLLSVQKENIKSKKGICKSDCIII